MVGNGERGCVASMQALQLPDAEKAKAFSGGVAETFVKELRSRCRCRRFRRICGVGGGCRCCNGR
jgi:hypothetical protein